MDKTNYSIKKMFTYSSSKPKILSFLGIVLICIMNLWIYQNKGTSNFHEGKVYRRTLSDNNAKKEGSSGIEKVKSKAQHSPCNISNNAAVGYYDYLKIYNDEECEKELSESDMKLLNQENDGFLEDMSESINKQIKELENVPSKDILRSIWFKVHCNERNKFLSLKYSIRKIHDKYFSDTIKNELLGKKVWKKCCDIIIDELLKLDSIQNSQFHILMQQETVTRENFEDFVKLCVNAYKNTKKETKKICIKKLKKALNQGL
ncbi:exported protein (PHISTc) [Plasmodium reichenowi]|uniref:Exported protein (PHISTc) n=1 Tax=Plasmodium reichenowi TaxID=5854 RepID=A0A151LF08_PLARE|nr:exported protein (PHISTc) [Plasmodium reichenowi]KYN97466.1 exported protein (PHISTc) [Plasmodium reichenowi]